MQIKQLDKTYLQYTNVFPFEQSYASCFPWFPVFLLSDANKQPCAVDSQLA